MTNKEKLQLWLAVNNSKPDQELFECVLSFAVAIESSVNEELEDYKGLYTVDKNTITKLRSELAELRTQLAESQEQMVMLREALRDNNIDCIEYSLG
jgi:uncharacterized coiled-coil protein SlyX